MLQPRAPHALARASHPSPLPPLVRLQYIFDAYMPGFQAGSSFILLHDFEETYTDFEDEAAQYAAFYFRMANEMVRQRRSFTSLFGLFESWGAIAAFLYLCFGLTAKAYNAYHFNRQVRYGCIAPPTALTNPPPAPRPLRTCLPSL